MTATARRAYLDTSLLLKRYLPEEGASELEAFLLDTQPELVASELARLELLSTLGRKYRDGHMRAEVIPHVQHAADIDFLHGAIRLLRLGSEVVRESLRLLQTLRNPVATLDCLHLATAIQASVELFMTNDRQLARAATECGLQVWPPLPRPTSKKTHHA